MRSYDRCMNNGVLRVGLVAAALLSGCGEDQMMRSPTMTSGCSVLVDDCGGADVCVFGTCEAAFGRQYTLSIGAATAAMTKPDGTTWDVGAEAPDMYLEIVVDGALVGSTGVVDDAYSATWPETWDIEVASEMTQLELLVSDEDLISDDFVVGCMPICRPPRCGAGKGSARPCRGRA